MQAMSSWWVDSVKQMAYSGGLKDEMVLGHMEGGEKVVNGIEGHVEVNVQER